MMHHTKCHVLIDHCKLNTLFYIENSTEFFDYSLYSKSLFNIFREIWQKYFHGIRNKNGIQWWKGWIKACIRYLFIYTYTHDDLRYESLYWKVCWVKTWGKKRSKKFNIFNFLIEKYQKKLCIFFFIFTKKGGKIFFSLFFFPFHVNVCHNVAQTHKFNSLSRSMTLHCVVLRKIHTGCERKNESNAKNFIHKLKIIFRVLGRMKWCHDFFKGIFFYII